MGAQTNDGVGLFQHHSGNFADHSGLFGQFDETRGGNQTMGGVVPAKQGFRLIDAVGSKVQLGLEVKAELFVGDGFAKLGDQLEAVGGALFQALFKRDAGLTHLFGQLTCNFSAPHERVWALTMFRVVCQPGVALNVQLVALNSHGTVEQAFYGVFAQKCVQI